MVIVLLFILLEAEKAAVWSIVAGYLLLPSSFSVDLAGLPPLDKKSVTILATFALCLVNGGRGTRRPIGLVMGGLALAYVLMPIASSFNNSYELQIGGLSHPGFYLSDAIKRGLLNLIELLGFFIGWRMLSTASGRAELLKALVVAVLAYSIPVLFEVRFSPQLHRWVYGFFPHDFGQQMRWGGFRAVVFLQHGLHVALFVVMGLIACCVAVRLRWSVLRLPPRLSVGYLWTVLVMCKSLGTIIYGVLLTPLVLFLPPRLWVKVASALLLLVCAYPALRSASLIPIQLIMGSATDISADRSESLGVRVQNENRLLKKALEKPAFGWGGGARSRVFDSVSGDDISITDGGWIILFGSYGWLGYLSLLGLFTVPVLRLNRRRGGPMGTEELVAAGLSLVLAANIVDMLPNDNITAITYLIAGSLAGYRRSIDKVKKVRRISETSFQLTRGESDVASASSKGTNVEVAA